MSIDSSDSLNCVKQEPDNDCTFEVVPQVSPYAPKVRLRGANGKHIAQFYENDGWFRCNGTGHMFEIIHVTGNQVYLHSAFITSQQFITNRQRSGNYGLAANPFAGSDCLFTISEPVISKEIYDVVYNIPDAHMTDVAPLIALNTTVRNDSTSDVLQTLTYSYTRYKVGTWNNTAGVEVGVTSSFSAGVPFIASVDLEISVTTSYSHEWGGSQGTEETITSSTQISVPAGKRGTATVIVKKKNLDVFFTCKERIRYRDGKTVINDKNGVYNNIESYTVDVQAGGWTDT